MAGGGQGHFWTMSKSYPLFSLVGFPKNTTFRFPHFHFAPLWSLTPSKPNYPQSKKCGTDRHGWKPLKAQCVHFFSQLEFCHNLSLFTIFVLSIFELCHISSFVTILFLSLFWFCDNLSFVTLSVFTQLEFCHNFSFVMI